MRRLQQCGIRTIFIYPVSHDTSSHPASPSSSPPPIVNITTLETCVDHKLGECERTRNTLAF